MSVPWIQLNDGHRIPQLGLGLFRVSPEDSKKPSSTRSAPDIDQLTQPRHIEMS